MRGAIAAALSANIPVLMSVGELALPALERFAGELCSIVDADPAIVEGWLHFQFGREAALTAAPSRRSVAIQSM